MFRCTVNQRSFVGGGFICGLGVVLVLAIAGLAGGCAQSQTTTGTVLPDLVKEPTKLLSKDEQKRAITEISHGKDAEMSSAEKQIEKGR